MAVIVVVGGRARRYAIYDLAFDIGLAHGVELGPLVIESPQFEHLNVANEPSPLDIEREGVPL